MSEYNNEVYIVTRTTGESGDLQDDIQLRSLTISSTKLGILVGDEIVKNNCLSLGFGFNKTSEDVMQQANVITSDHLRMHRSSANALKSIDSKSIPQAHGSEHHQTTVHMERLDVLEEDLKQNIESVIKLSAKYSKNPNQTGRPQMEEISLDAAWTQELVTINHKCMNIFICQKNPVDLTHSRFNIKPGAENIFALSAFTHLFRSCRTSRVMPLVSPCSLGLAVLQHSISFLPRGDRKERKGMFRTQSDTAAVDPSTVRTSAIVNEQKTTLPVMSISLVEGGHILLLLSKKTKKHLDIHIMLVSFNEKP